MGLRLRFGLNRIFRRNGNPLKNIWMGHLYSKTKPSTDHHLDSLSFLAPPFESDGFSQWPRRRVFFFVRGFCLACPGTWLLDMYIPMLCGCTCWPLDASTMTLRPCQSRTTMNWRIPIIRKDRIFIFSFSPRGVMGFSLLSWLAPGTYGTTLSRRYTAWVFPFSPKVLFL